MQDIASKHEHVHIAVIKNKSKLYLKQIKNI